MEDYGYNHNDYISCLRCRRDGGGTAFAFLVISTCPTKELANRDGSLVCAANAGPTATDPVRAVPSSAEPAQPAKEPADASPAAATAARDKGEAASRKSAGGGKSEGGGGWRSNE